MNFGKLLGVGKSFVTWRSGKAYNKNRRAYLPKFNAGNPFEPKAAESAPVAGPKPVKSAPPTTRAVAISKPVAKPTRVTTWTDKLNPFRAPAPVAPPTYYKAVQAELSLDAVKPVSNDLSDADIEVVPVKSRTVVAADLMEDRMDWPVGTRPKSALELADVPMLPLPRKTWEFVGERLMKPV